MPSGKPTARGKALAHLIKQARAEAGLSQRACAEAAGVPISWLQRMELGEFDRPDASRMARLIGLLPIDHQQLLAISGQYIPEELPDARAYLRAKYGATDVEIAQFDDYLTQIEAGRKARDSRSKKKLPATAPRPAKPPARRTTKPPATKPTKKGAKQ